MGWDACTLEPSAILRWMECHPGLAGYVQAVGVVLALVGAVFGPPAKAAYERWKWRRTVSRNADRFARRRRPDIELLLTRIDARLEQLGAGPIALAATTSIERFGIEIPGGVDPQLLIDPSQLDMARLAFLFGFVGEVKAYNNGLFGRPIAPGDDDPDSFRKYLLARLKNLSGQGLSVLKTINRRSLQGTFAFFGK